MSVGMVEAEGDVNGIAIVCVSLCNGVYHQCIYIYICMLCVHARMCVSV